MKILILFALIVFYAVYIFVFYYPRQEIKMLYEEIDKRDELIKELKMRLYFEKNRRNESKKDETN